MSRRRAVGIDLGTTYSCVGVVKNGNVEIIPNVETGNRTTSSCVAFTKEGRVVGDGAADQACVNPNNTVFEAKRIIGCKYNNVEVQKVMKYWPFKVVGDCKGRPKVKVEYKNQEKFLFPEEISAMVLQKLKGVAEKYLGCIVEDAVITVPAYFTDSQRQATKDAGKIAGLNVLSIINEPTAAAVAYGVHRRVIESRNILVYDLGGGTFDVAVLNIRGVECNTVAVGGDTHLGGGNFDTVLLKYCLAKILKNHGVDLFTDSRALGRLRKNCEKAKRMLSFSLKTIIDIPHLIGDKEFKLQIRRSRFERLCSKMFDRTLELVYRTLSSADMSKGDIDEVVLVGGSTRIPLITKLLQEAFAGKPLNRTLNPDEAVAYGAAVMAATASGDGSIKEIKLADVIPMTLGLTNAKGSMIPFLKRNTRIPVTKIQANWTTAADYQTRGLFSVYEGENKLVADNNFLGSFYLNNLEHGIKGTPKIDVSFTLDSNGILHVNAFDTKTGSRSQVTITADKSCLSQLEITKLIQTIKQYEEVDVNDNSLEEEEEVVIPVSGLLLQRYCYALRLAVGSRSRQDRITDGERDRVYVLTGDTLDLLHSAGVGVKRSTEQFGRAMVAIQEECAPMLAKLAYLSPN